MRRRTFVFSAAISAMVWPALASAAPLTVGDALPQLHFENQHGKMEAFPGAGTRVVLFAIEKTPSDEVNTFLTNLGAEGVRKEGIVFLADISGMPSFVTQTFALPKMRKRPYSILLVNKVEQAAFMPHEKDAVTVLQVHQGKITQIAFAHDAAAIKAAVNAQ